MNIFLFLYPVREYFEEGEIGLAMRRFSQDGHSIQRLSEIINARYRDQGFKIWWLLFSASPDDPDIPDVSRLAPLRAIQWNDSSCTCGVTFAEHTQHKKYPNTSFILQQLPPRINRLVLGGFHQWDCVDTLAAAAHARGIPVAVDMDTTEHFFYRTNREEGEIPLVRPLTDHINELLQHRLTSTLIHEEIDEKIAEIKSKPWLMPTSPA